MKKELFLILLLSAFISFGQQKNFSFNAALAEKNNIFYPGDTIRMELTYSCPVEYRMAGWNASGRVQNLPPSFLSATNLKASGKDPRWRSVHFMTWKWFADEKSFRNVEFSTVGWPEGDYMITVTTVFRKKENAEHRTDKYINSFISFTLEK